MKKKIQELKNEKLSYTFEVRIDINDLRDAMDKKLLTFSKSRNIHGFRSGKAPINILRRLYDKQIRSDTIQDIIQHTSEDLLRKKNIIPAFQPKIDIKSIEEGLVYHLHVDQMPDIPEIDFKKIFVPIYRVLPSNTEVLDALNKLSKEMADLVRQTADYHAKLGDTIVIDFVGKINFQLFDGGSKKNHRLVLGSNSFIPGFEEQLIGCKQSDHITVNVIFPENYYIKDLSQKNAIFEVDVHEIFSSQEKMIDDKFAQSFGMRDLNDLKNIIEKRLIESYESDVMYLTKKSLLDSLYKQCRYNIPENLIKIELEEIIRNIRQNQQDKDNNKTDDLLKNEYFAIAKRRVSLRLFFTSFGEKNNVQVLEKDLQDALQKQILRFPENQRHKILQSYKKNPQLLLQFHGPIFEEKITNLILSLVVKEEKIISSGELQKLIQESENRN